MVSKDQRSEASRLEITSPGREFTRLISSFMSPEVTMADEKSFARNPAIMSQILLNSSPCYRCLATSVGPEFGIFRT